MKRLLGSSTAVIAIAIVAALTLFSGTALAASCSPTGAGGEKAPQLVNGGAGIAESAQGGYNCTVGWYALVQPQYESGGTWHDAVDVGPYPKHGNFAANTGHNWTDGEKDPTAELPACAFNWRFSILFYNSSTNINFASTISAQLGKTC